MNECEASRYVNKFLWWHRCYLNPPENGRWGTGKWSHDFKAGFVRMQWDPFFIKELFAWQVAVFSGAIHLNVSFCSFLQGLFMSGMKFERSTASVWCIKQSRHYRRCSWVIAPGRMQIQSPQINRVLMQINHFPPGSIWILCIRSQQRQIIIHRAICICQTGLSLGSIDDVIDSARWKLILWVMQCHGWTVSSSGLFGGLKRETGWYFLDVKDIYFSLSVYEVAFVMALLGICQALHTLFSSRCQLVDIQQPYWLLGWKSNVPCDSAQMNEPDDVESNLLDGGLFFWGVTWLESIKEVVLESRDCEPQSVILCWQREARGSVTLKIVPSYRIPPAQCEVSPCDYMWVHVDMKTLNIHGIFFQIFVRALFDYDPREDDLIPCSQAGIHFKIGDILQVIWIPSHFSPSFLLLWAAL